MSISAISSNSTASTQGSTNANPIAQDWKALQTALKQGDVSGAQTAFASLQMDLANSPTGTPAADSPVGKALAQLQTALQKGDLTGAQSAFAALQAAFKNGHHKGGDEDGGGCEGGGGMSGGGASSQTAVAVPAQATSGAVLDTSA